MADYIDYIEQLLAVSNRDLATCPSGGWPSLSMGGGGELPSGSNLFDGIQSSWDTVDRVGYSRGEVCICNVCGGS